SHRHARLEHVRQDRGQEHRPRVGRSRPGRNLDRGHRRGFDFTSANRTARVRLQNLTQIFNVPVIVSDTARAVDPAGVSDEYMLQIMYGMQEESRNIEAALFKAATASATGDDASAARVLKGFRGFVGMTGTRAFNIQQINEAGNASFLISTAK